MQSERFDVVILDLMLPGLNGLDVLRKSREGGDKTPILILTAKGSTEERIEGLDTGADDYLVKPFEVQELLARVRALTRRGPESSLQYSDLILNKSARMAERDGRKIYLSTTELALLEYLMRRPEKAIAKSELLEVIWGDPYRANPNVVEVYISHLRAKTEHRREPRLIHTVRGKGYMLSQGEP